MVIATQLLFTKETDSRQRIKRYLVHTDCTNLNCLVLEKLPFDRMNMSGLILLR